MVPRPQAFSHVYIDFASLPETDEFKGVFLIVDEASRLVMIIRAPAFTAAVALRGLETWFSVFGFPETVHADGGRHFACKSIRLSLDGYGVDLHIGTPYNSRGRGVVERKVGLFKQALMKILPPGQSQLWPTLIDQLQRQLNALPSRALGGFSPYQYAFGVPPKPLFWLPTSDDNEQQQQENINIALDSIRFIADSCCDTIALNRAADSAETSNNISFSEGDMVALHQADRPNSLAPHFSGPYQVVDHSGEGWYTVCEVLADDNLGPGINTHVDRLIPYDMSRFTSTELHQAKLIPGFYVVKDVLDGPRTSDGHFHVSWHHTDITTWESAQSLLHVLRFQEYCTRTGLNNKGEKTSLHHRRSTTSSQASPDNNDTRAARASRRNRHDMTA